MEWSDAEDLARSFYLELITIDLGGFRDLVVALAERYPQTDIPTKVVDNGLRHLSEGLLIIQRHRAAAVTEDQDVSGGPTSRRYSARR